VSKPKVTKKRAPAKRTAPRSSSRKTPPGSRHVSKPKVLAAGYHDGVPMADYVADAISPEPSVSTGVVEALVRRSPAHARAMHPRYGGAGDEATTRSDLGVAAHYAILGGGRVIFAPKQHTDWKKKAAQEFRKAARARGDVALLDHQREQLEAIKESARSVIDGLHGPGKAEQTMLWQDPDTGVWCRGRADFLTGDGGYDLELKSAENAEHGIWIRRCLHSGSYDLQAALRARGHEVLGGRTRDVVFVVVELEPPYGCTRVAMSPTYREATDGEVRKALEQWATCLKTNRWPSYSRDIRYAEPPAWKLWDLEARELAEAS
jgi:hypothetical protein